jgi:hypothetical protein
MTCAPDGALVIRFVNRGRRMRGSAMTAPRRLRCIRLQNDTSQTVCASRFSRGCLLISSRGRGWWSVTPENAPAATLDPTGSGSFVKERPIAPPDLMISPADTLRRWPQHRQRGCWQCLVRNHLEVAPVRGICGGLSRPVAARPLVCRGGRSPSY